MTLRIKENNIIKHLKKFNKNQIRETQHSKCKKKIRKVSFEKIVDLLLNESPIKIEQQENKKFALTYKYNEQYNLFIVISLKDKFINIVTLYPFTKK